MFWGFNVNMSLCGNHGKVAGAVQADFSIQEQLIS